MIHVHMHTHIQVILPDFDPEVTEVHLIILTVEGGHNSGRYICMYVYMFVRIHVRIRIYVHIYM
jgi:hypothetical protein